MNKPKREEKKKKTPLWHSLQILCKHMISCYCSCQFSAPRRQTTCSYSITLPLISELSVHTVPLACPSFPDKNICDRFFIIALEVSPFKELFLKILVLADANYNI